MTLVVNLNQTFKEVYEFFTDSLINKKEVIFHNSFCEASVMQPKPDKNITKKENYNNINLLYFIIKI